MIFTTVVFTLPYYYPNYYNYYQYQQYPNTQMNTQMNNQMGSNWMNANVQQPNNDVWYWKAQDWKSWAVLGGTFFSLGWLLTGLGWAADRSHHHVRARV